MSHRPKVYYTRKRRRDEKIEDQLKNLKSGNEAEEEITFQTNLTDVNDDCLEKIFMLLSPTDLINIAHTNKALKNATDMAFERKFGRKPFKFCYIQGLPIKRNYVEIHDLKTSLRLLRCFGHLITDLAMGYHKRFGKDPNLLFHYMNEYCSQSLTTISFHHFPEYVLEKFIEKPFQNIETLKFVDCNVGKKLSTLNTWFPVMRSLTLEQSRFTDRSSIETHFSQLEQLKIKSVSPNCRLEYLRAIFRLNPQLRRLFLIGSDATAYLQSASQYLPVLEHLTICASSQALSDGNEIHFKTMRKLELDIWFNFRPVVLRRINLDFDHLAEVQMELSEDSVIDAAVDFFKQHPSITKLKLQIDALLLASKDKMMKIVAVLPMLNDLTLYVPGYFIENNILSVEETIQFLAKYNLLTSFVFSISNPDDFNQLQSKLVDGWLVSINCDNLGKRVELKRRT